MINVISKVPTNFHLRVMKNCFIELTLMRNSMKVLVDVNKIHSYKAFILGAGSLMSFSEILDGSDTMMVDESPDQIEEKLFNLECKNSDIR